MPNAHFHLWSGILVNDQKSAIESASVRNEFFTKNRRGSSEIENLSTSNCYFSELKDFSLDGLAM